MFILSVLLTCIPGFLLKQKKILNAKKSFCNFLGKKICYENKLKCTVFFLINWEDLPGQAQESHIRVSTAFPTHDLPPNIGAGDVQLLARRWVPPPQVTLHDDQGSQ